MELIVKSIPRIPFSKGAAAMLLVSFINWQDKNACDSLAKYQQKLTKQWTSLVFDTKFVVRRGWHSAKHIEFFTYQHHPFHQIR